MSVDPIYQPGTDPTQFPAAVRCTAPTLADGREQRILQLSQALLDLLEYVDDNCDGTLKWEGPGEFSDFILDNLYPLTAPRTPVKRSTPRQPGIPKGPTR